MNLSFVINLKIFFIAISIFFIFLISFLLIGERETAIGWFFLIAIFLIPLIYSFNSSSEIIKFFCGISFITSLVTMPVFYLTSDNYQFNDVKPFDFMASDIFSIFIPIGIFLILITFITNLFFRIFPYLNFEREFNQDEVILITSKDKKKLYLRLHSFIIFIAIICIPFFLWTYSNGIAITGVEPPSLPYKISGISYYLKGFILPLLIAYLYIKSSRSNFFIILMICIFAIANGMTSASKGMALIPLAPIVAFSWVDKRYFQMIIVGLFALLAVLIIQQSRELIYFPIMGMAGDSLGIGADTSIGIFITFIDLMKNFTFDIESITVFAALLGRIEGFQSLVLASQFDIFAVGQPFDILLKMINGKFAVFDHDAYHIAWQGNTVPPGFYNGGSLTSWVIVASKYSLLIFIMMAFVTSFFLITIEFCLKNIAIKYSIGKSLYQAGLFLMVILFFSGVGTSTFLQPFLVLLIVTLLPRIRI